MGDPWTESQVVRGMRPGIYPPWAGSSQRPSTHGRRSYTRNEWDMKPKTYMLVDQQDSNVLPRRELLERSLNNWYLRLWPPGSSSEVWWGRTHAVWIRTRVYDEEVLLLVPPDVAYAG